jgi:hypothetical protein
LAIFSFALAISSFAVYDLATLFFAIYALVISSFAISALAILSFAICFFGICSADFCGQTHLHRNNIVAKRSAWERPGKVGVTVHHTIQAFLILGRNKVSHQIVAVKFICGASQIWVCQGSALWIPTTRDPINGTACASPGENQANLA